VADRARKHGAYLEGIMCVHLHMLIPYLRFRSQVERVLSSSTAGTDKERRRSARFLCPLWLALLFTLTKPWVLC
jgi:hypothetical protein